MESVLHDCHFHPPCSVAPAEQPMKCRLIAKKLNLQTNYSLYVHKIEDGDHHRVESSGVFHDE